MQDPINLNNCIVTTLKLRTQLIVESSNNLFYISKINLVTVF